jgi:hypothetical protein
VTVFAPYYFPEIHIFYKEFYFALPFLLRKTTFIVGWVVRVSVAEQSRRNRTPFAILPLMFGYAFGTLR